MTLSLVRLLANIEMIQCQRPGPQLCDINKPGNWTYTLVGFVVVDFGGAVVVVRQSERVDDIFRWRGPRRFLGFVSSCGLCVVVSTID